MKKTEAKKIKITVPPEVAACVAALHVGGFEAYIVGGCVRDAMLGREPNDWDVTTSAKPEEILKIFPDSVYENTFGTVGVKTASENPRLAIVEVTPYRTESGYQDMRHPDRVEFVDSLEKDLARRDFTMNAIAMAIDGSVVDPFGGAEDIKNGVIRTVGEATARFTEDGLRLLRAVRFSCQLGFTIEKKTAEAVHALSANLARISKERIRDEVEKLIMTEHAAEGIRELERMGLLANIFPEVREGIGVGQNKHHTFTVFEHNVKALEYAAKKNYPLTVRLAALLHDVAKPHTKRGEGINCTFYGHQVVGAKLAERALRRLTFSADVIAKVTLLIREHMFVYDVGMVTDAGVRRLLRRVGYENIDDLFHLREADRIGSGVPKAQPYRLRHLRFMVEKVSKDPISVKMLAVRGDDVMRILKIEPGPKIGMILNALLGEALEDPSINTPEVLEARVRALAELPEKELRKLAERGLGTREERQEEAEDEIKKRFAV
jgi:tRNA nucleotidyltransferase (CCA-adding enzyme)